MRDIALSTIALLFTALTTVLLVWDLEHKERFLRVVFTPQSKSWLARGAFILIAYSGLCGAVLARRLCWDFRCAASFCFGRRCSSVLCAAVYTAFLFGQCEGRDLWQTPLLPVHLIVQTLMCGAAVLALLPTFARRYRSNARSVASLALVITLGYSFADRCSAKFLMPHTTDNSRYAARLITHGPFKRWFWGGAVVIGGIVPLCLLLLVPVGSSAH